MSSKKNTLYILSAVFIVLMFIFLALFVRSKSEWMLIIGVIMMNSGYQVITRLLVGTICEGVFENGVNSSANWFKTSDFEERFYGFLGIKYLKRNLPKTERTDFSLTQQSLQDIIDTGCEIEAEHEINIVVSMLSILLAIPFGYIWMFIVFAVGGVLYDFLFISVQRYNRPRLVTVQLKRHARFFEKMEREDKLQAAEVAETDAANDDNPAAAEAIGEETSGDDTVTDFNEKDDDSEEDSE